MTHRIRGGWGGGLEKLSGNCGAGVWRGWAQLKQALLWALLSRRQTVFLYCCLGDRDRRRKASLCGCRSGSGLNLLAGLSLSLALPLPLLLTHIHLCA